MPCRYDPTPEEIRQSQIQTAKRMDMLARSLCASLNHLKETDLQFYHDLLSKDEELNEWWKSHQELDAARKLREQRDAERRQLAQSALAKLTKEEREVLGL